MTIDRTAALIALLAKILPTHEPNLTRRIPDGATDASGALVRSYCLLYGGAPITQARPLDGSTHQTLRTWQAVVVSNGPTGCRLMAERVRVGVDNVIVAGARAQVGMVTGPDEDRDDPTAWRWSMTVDIEIRD